MQREALLRTGRYGPYESSYVRKDGSIVWTHVSLALVRKSDGQPDYFVAVIENIARDEADTPRKSLSTRAMARLVSSADSARKRA